MHQYMSQNVELRIPADESHIVVAKRCASALASVAGFDVEAIDDLTIAVTQACENAIECLRSAGARAGKVDLLFKLEDASIQVEVKTSVSRSAEDAARAAEESRRREQERRVQAVREQAVRLAASNDLALRLMGLLVDDHSYRFDQRTGGLRVRLTKYRIS